MTSLSELVRARRTTKVFGPEPLDRATIAELLDLARWAPNHHLTNPWRFTVLGPQALARLKDAAGTEAGEREPDAAYWAGPLLNNLAWAYYDAGEYGRALGLFESALEARERDPENEAAIAWARYGVAQALRALGRADEAVAAIEPAVEWSRRAGKPEPDFHDELAACYEAVGRAEEARRQVGLAVRMRGA
jgi:nitroreductase